MKRAVCVLRPAGAFLWDLARRRCANNSAHHGPAAVWRDARRCLLGSSRARERCAFYKEGGPTGVDWGCYRHQEVFKAGTGMAVSNVVTRRNSALTGHDVGRCKSSRSLYCLIWVATLNKVRITVRLGVSRAWGEVFTGGWLQDVAAHDSIAEGVAGTSG